jgi:hypothetical protein
MEASTFSCLLKAQSPASKGKESRPGFSGDPAASSPSDPSKPKFRFLSRQISVDSEASEVCKKAQSTVAEAEAVGEEDIFAMAEDEAEDKEKKSKQEELAVAEDKAKQDKKEAEDELKKGKETAEDEVKKGKEEEQAVAEDTANKKKKAEKDKLEDNDEAEDEDNDEVEDKNNDEVEDKKRPAAASSSSSSSSGANKCPAAASSSGPNPACKRPAAALKRPAAPVQKRPAAAANKRPAAAMLCIEDGAEEEEEAREEETEHNSRKRMRKEFAPELDSEEHLSSDHEQDHSETDVEEDKKDEDKMMGEEMRRSQISGDEEDKKIADSDASGNVAMVEESDKSDGGGDEEEEEEEENEEEEEEEEEGDEEMEGNPRIRTVGIANFDPGAHLMAPYVCLTWMLNKLNSNDVQTALEFLGLRLIGNLWIAADMDSTLALGRDITCNSYSDNQLPQHTVRLKLEKRLVSPGKHNIVMTCKLHEGAQPIKQLGSLALNPNAGGRFNHFLFARIFMGWRCIVEALQKSDVIYPGEDLISLMCTQVKQWRFAATMRPFRSLYP